MVSVADGGGYRQNKKHTNSSYRRRAVSSFAFRKTCVIMQHYASWHSQLDPGLRRDDDLNKTLHFKKTPEWEFKFPSIGSRKNEIFVGDSWRGAGW